MPHISFSELVTWNECPHKHKLKYVEKVHKFFGNEFTAFGTSIHNVCEDVLLDETVDMKRIFLESMDKEAKSLKRKGVQIDEKFWGDLKEQGVQLTNHILPATMILKDLLT